MMAYCNSMALQTLFNVYDADGKRIVYCNFGDKKMFDTVGTIRYIYIYVPQFKHITIFICKYLLPKLVLLFTSN
jgi:hypothetical protein